MYVFCVSCFFQLYRYCNCDRPDKSSIFPRFLSLSLCVYVDNVDSFLGCLIELRDVCFSLHASAKYVLYLSSTHILSLSDVFYSLLSLYICFFLLFLSLPAYLAYVYFSLNRRMFICILYISLCVCECICCDLCFNNRLVLFLLFLTLLILYFDLFRVFAN